jgi:hypothetical protein
MCTFASRTKLVAAMALSALCSGSPVFAQAGSPPPTTTIETIILQLKQPMQFVHVVSAEPSCQPNCPEWISAEGQIMIGTAQTFARFIAGLGGRRLPILISSPGGSMPDAMAMGRLIRARHLAVAVARTEMSPCPANQPKCAPSRGLARLASSICMSACPAVLAGGVERYVSGVSPIGVHQIKLGPKTVVRRLYQVQYRIVDGKKQEISRTLMSQQQSTVATTSLDLSTADSSVAKYLAEMGVGDSIIKSMLLTPSSTIDLLSNAELIGSRLATLWMLDSPFASTDGPDGLAGAPVGSSSILSATFVASLSGEVLSDIDGARANVEATLQYRRGGGTVFVSLTLVDAPSAAPLARQRVGSFLISNGKSDRLVFQQPAPGEAANGRIPLRDFCRLRGGQLDIAFVEPTLAVAESPAREWPARIELAKAPGAAALFDEACPPGGLAAR